MKKKLIACFLISILFVLQLNKSIVIAETGRIGCALLENGEIVSGRVYTNDESRDEEKKILLGKVEDKPLKMEYKEAYSVKNIGTMDIFARVIVNRYWMTEEGEKNRELDSATIEFITNQNNGWFIDESSSSSERIILYHSKSIAPNEITANFIDGIKINESILSEVTQKVKTDSNGYKTIEMIYDYNNMIFGLDIEVGAVQTHNAVEAIKSAWGVDVIVSDDGKTISLAD